MTDNQDFSDKIGSEPNIYSFVVRIWKEELGDGPAVWRGHITPVPDGTRHYFTDMDEIPAFISDFLKSG